MWIGKLIRLPWRDKLLLAGSALLLPGFKMALCVFSFHTVFRIVKAVSPSVPESSRVDSDLTERVAWAVQLAAHCLPGMSCLPQALVARLILGWYRQPCRLRIGVAKAEGGMLEAHAWVERGGCVLVGGGESSARFVPLAGLAE